MRRWVGPDLYVAFFLLLLVGLFGPFLLGGILDTLWPRLGMDAALVLGYPANAALVALVFRRCSHPSLSFWNALLVMVNNNMSGCANISVLYMFPLLGIVYILAVVYTLIGLFAGKDFTLKHWSKVVSRVAKIPLIPPRKYVIGEATTPETVSPAPPPAPTATTAPETERIKCPWCAEWIMPDAKICRYCGRELPTRSTYLEPSTKPKHQ